MISPDLIQTLNELNREDLRKVIAHAAGLHAHRDGDNGDQVRRVLHIIAKRVSLQPRAAA
jgi:hypothetical protein